MRDGATILATVRRTPDDVVIFASNDRTYTIRYDGKSWQWTDVQLAWCGDAPFSIYFADYRGARRNLARWLSRWRLAPGSLAELAWMAPHQRARDGVLYPD